MPRTPIHPGEHLAEELRQLGISAAELARQIDVPVNRITGIINGQRGITADTALRLGHWFDTSPQFWMNLQQQYELRLAEKEVGRRLRRCRAARRCSRHERLEKPHEPPHQENEPKTSRARGAQGGAPVQGAQRETCWAATGRQAGREASALRERARRAA